jgi:hypothetical protein
MLPKMTRGFISAQIRCWLQNRNRKLSHCRLRNHQRDWLPAEAWIICAHSPCWLGKHHRKLSSCRLRNHQRQCFQVWCVDSLGHKVPFDSEISSDKWVAADSETINETASPIDAWIRPSTQSLLTRKLSLKTESLPTQKPSTRLPPQLKPGFVHTHSPCWL